ncbi:UNVERIFIED_CONTAM: hypothetical protein Scaly_0901300 [Sesamum calycinum]|uniref:Uncharacterized protein n=1 Tax=Sesamum calycinum TaxID=2727403 RepID=A0AAW2QWR4_9LAMI
MRIYIGLILELSSSILFDGVTRFWLRLRALLWTPSSGRPDDFRSYSASYASASSSSSYNYAPPPVAPPQKLKKGKSTGGSTSKSWSITDPEFQRKKRVASYKVYSVEGKVKGTFRKSFRWLKDRYTQVVMDGGDSEILVIGLFLAWYTSELFSSFAVTLLSRASFPPGYKLVVSTETGTDGYATVIHDFLALPYNTKPG